MGSRVWQENAEKFHKEFNDFMWHYFGLNEHPGYYPIKIILKLINGQAVIYRSRRSGKDRAEIRLRNPLTKEDFEWTVMHESAHLLHPLAWKIARRKFESGGRRDSTEKESYLLGFVADYASLFFVRQKRQDIKPPKELAEDVVGKIFEIDSNLLPELANIGIRQMDRYFINALNIKSRLSYI